MSETIVGFTGSREGMTVQQRYTLIDLLRITGCTELHHGDCLGADKYAHQIALILDIYIVKHPPSNDALRAYMDEGRELEPRPYLERNKDIVDASEYVIACPAQAKELVSLGRTMPMCVRLQSGTWATVRYARKFKRPIAIIYPNGSYARENDFPAPTN